MTLGLIHDPLKLCNTETIAELTELSTPFATHLFLNEVTVKLSANQLLFSFSHPIRLNLRIFHTEEC